MTGIVHVPTEFGSAAIIWNRTGLPTLRRILLPAPGQCAAAKASMLYPKAVLSRCSETDHAVSLILSVLSGNGGSFPLELLDMTVCTPFQLRVLTEEMKVPRGSVTTYGRLSDILGIPGGARAVGGALARNPFPLAIPCHRAVRSDGRIGGFQGGTALKRLLLEREGIQFSASGKVRAALT